MFLKLDFDAILFCMGKINTVCVFTGSSYGSREAYREDALKLAQIFKDNDITLVYGAKESWGCLQRNSSTLVGM